MQLVAHIGGKAVENVPDMTGESILKNAEKIYTLYDWIFVDIFVNIPFFISFYGENDWVLRITFNIFLKHENEFKYEWYHQKIFFDMIFVNKYL